ncbi:MAG: TonB-dependent receptor [Saprospirales bacterium]|nr:MAG: TonB-dependent receptor [Saprospirales bacterium]
MREIFFISVLITIVTWSLNAQNITGKIIDSKTAEPLIGVNILVVEENRGATSRLDGTFEIRMDQIGDYTLRFTYIGYEQFDIRLSDGKMDLGEIEMNPGDLRLDEIIVTASPVGSGFRYQAAQVYSGELLRQKVDMSLGVMLDGEPGLSMRSFGPAPARPVIRGFDGDRVLVLQNGERMGDLSGTAHDHVVALEPLATDRIEIVRGPSSLLYGSSAIGGVVNLMTSDIPPHWNRGAEGRISLQGATNNNMFGGFGKLTYGWDNHAVTGRLSYRTSGEVRTPEGKLPGTEMENFEGSLGWGFRGAGYTGGIAFMAMDMVYGIPEEIDEPDEFIEIRLDKQMAQARVDFDLGGRFFDQLEFRINGGRFFQQEIEAEIEDDGSIDEDVELEFTQVSMSSTVLLKHQPFSIFDRGALGLNVYGRNLEVGGDEAFTPGDKNINIALFTFQEIPLSNKVRLQAGVRGESYNIRTISNEFFPDIDETRSGFNFSASTGLNFRPNENLEIGVQLARAFRNPSLEELFAFGPHLGAGAFEIGDPNLDVEVSYGSDAFVSWRNENFHIEAAAFFNHIEDYVIFQSTGMEDDASGLPIFNYLADQARMMGGELNLSWKATERVLITSGIDYVQGDRTGTVSEPLPFIPPFRFRTGIRWDNNRTFFGVDMRAVAEQDRVASEEDPTPGYTLFNAEAGYKFDEAGRHSIVIKGQNIFDKSYRDHLSRVRERGNPMPGRNISLAYHFIF